METQGLYFSTSSNNKSELLTPTGISYEYLGGNMREEYLKCLLALAKSNPSWIVIFITYNKALLK